MVWTARNIRDGQVVMDEIQYATTSEWVAAAHALLAAGEEVWPADLAVRLMFGFIGGGKHHLIHITTARNSPLPKGQPTLLRDNDGRRKLLLGV